MRFTITLKTHLGSGTESAGCCWNEMEVEIVAESEKRSHAWEGHVVGFVVALIEAHDANVPKHVYAIESGRGS